STLLGPLGLTRPGNLRSEATPAGFPLLSVSSHILTFQGRKGVPHVRRPWIELPEQHRAGVTLNEDVVRQHLAPGSGYLEPTTQWDHERFWARLSSSRPRACFPNDGLEFTPLGATCTFVN